MAMSMNMTDCVAALGRYRKLGFLSAALIAAGAVGGWGISATFVKSAAALEARQESDTIKQNAKASLVGSYVVTGTDPDGEAYLRAKTVDISLAPSGALELDWDSGKHVGVGQVINDVLVVSYSRKSRNVISIMNINPDGSLSGNWFRRTDRGSKGTETWKKAT
jgi:hypothetical protein